MAASCSRASRTISSAEIISMIESDSDEDSDDLDFLEFEDSDTSDSGSSGDSNEESEAEEVPRPANQRRPNLQPQRAWEDGEFEPIVFPFVPADVGISALSEITIESSEFEIFSKIFDEELVYKIVTESNKYIEYLKANTEVKAKSKLHLWQDVTENELHVFLAIVVLMALQKKPRIKDYWSTDPLISSPMFGKLMSLDRFRLILRSLHFSDNEAQIAGDRLHKIRPVLELLKSKFKSIFVPYQNVVIDESLMLWKGRLAFKQYIPSKRHRFGIKLFILCDCKTGYVLDFMVYTGATTEYTAPQDEVGISGAIVLTLMEPYLGKGYTLYTDNWYSSPALAEKLHAHRTGTCGTVKKNRKGLPNFPLKTKKGDLIQKHTDNLLALKWHDKREVHMLSSVNNTGQSPSGKIDRVSKEPIFKPTCIVEYNKRMGAIDKSDMMLSFTECVRKSVKWYKKFFFHLLDLAILNSFILYKESHRASLELADFRLELVRQIIELKHRERKNPKGGRTSRQETPLRLVERHFPSLVPPTEKRQDAMRQCKVCSHTNLQQRKRKESRYMCKDCNVGLCVSPCFEKYHSLKEF